MPQVKSFEERYKTGEKSFTAKEYAKLLEVCDCLEDEVMIRLAAATGARRDDFADIKISNINFVDHTLTYYQRKKRNYVTVNIGGKMENLLIKHKKTKNSKDTMLFSVKGRQLYNRMHTLCRKAGIPERPFHAWRATCVKFHQAAGWSPEAVAKLIDDTLSVVQMHYMVPSADEMRELSRDKEVF